MSGDTVNFRKGSTFNVEGKLYGENNVPFDYSLAEILVYDTLNINQTELDVVATNKAQGLFTVSLTNLESEKLPAGRNSWFKLQLYYAEPPPVQALVLPAVWINAE